MDEEDAELDLRTTDDSLGIEGIVKAAALHALAEKAARYTAKDVLESFIVLKEYFKQVVII